MLSRLGARLAGLCGLMLMIGVSACRKDPLEVIKDRKSTRLNSSHSQISYAVFCLKKKNAFLGMYICLPRMSSKLSGNGPAIEAFVRLRDSGLFQGVSSSSSLSGAKRTPIIWTFT